MSDERQPLLQNWQQSPDGNDNGSSSGSPVNTDPNQPNQPNQPNDPNNPSQDPPPENGDNGNNNDDNTTWGEPAGLEPRGEEDESLVTWRKALGIQIDPKMCEPEPSNVEEGQLPDSSDRCATNHGLYHDVLRLRRTKYWQSLALNTGVWASHVTEILVGAALTSLGPGAGEHTRLITGLGAVNTVLAGLLALIKGQGLPERLRHEAVEFHHLQDWIEETDSLLQAGAIGRDRKELGQLIETAFKKYNDVMKGQEENYTPPGGSRRRPDGSQGSGGSGGSGNSGNGNGNGNGNGGGNAGNGNGGAPSNGGDQSGNGNGNGKANAMRHR